jgi:hypothetical protein
MLRIWFQGSFIRVERGLTVRHLEDFVTWVDSSKIKRNIMKYSDKVPPFVTSTKNSSTILIYYNLPTWYLLTFDIS